MILQSIWFFLWGLLWAVFFITDGFDFGVGTLYPFLGKTDRDKRVMINSLGPLWDGNEVWLITAGGVHLRRVSAGVRHHVLFAVHRLDVDPLRLDPARRIL